MSAGTPCRREVACVGGRSLVPRPYRTVDGCAVCPDGTRRLVRSPPGGSGGRARLPALREAADPGTRQPRARRKRSGTIWERWCAGHCFPQRSDVPSGFSSAIGEPSWSGPWDEVPDWPRERSIRGLERGMGTRRVRSSGLRSSVPSGTRKPTPEARRSKSVPEPREQGRHPALSRARARGRRSRARSRVGDRRLLRHRCVAAVPRRPPRDLQAFSSSSMLFLGSSQVSNLWVRYFFACPRSSIPGSVASPPTVFSVTRSVASR